MLHIPNLARKLIYVGNMDVAGVKTVCGDGGCKMVWGSMVLMRGVWFGTLYKLLGKTIIDECKNSVVLEEGDKDDKTLTASGGKKMLWHQRLGHIREKGLRALQGKGMTNFTLDFDLCEHCIYGKQNRVRIASGPTRAKGILELIHSDVFGPVPVPSLGKSVYYVSFIDDFSRKIWIYFLRKKSEVFAKFKEFKALVENQSEKK